MSAPEPCVNYYGTRRHFSANLAPRPYLGRGREGKSLCTPGGIPVDVYDQEAHDQDMEAYHGKKVNIAALPECKSCARKLTKVA